MTLISILQVIAALGTIATGLFALLRPHAIQSFTGLTAPGARGVTEFRAIFGAFFIALGAVPLILNSAETYFMLGIAYLAIFVVRLVSMVLDKSYEKSNYISLVTEIALGIILIL
jgi:hypothetical protein